MPVRRTALAAEARREGHSHADVPAYRRALLGWYDRNRRDLPWRHTRDPYRIWVSEIMLQQTRVAAVLEHYRLFLERFPDVERLAAASESDVLTAWSGLGYYRRARMLRQCAQAIVAQHKGEFPTKASALQSLPGIGRYTAAAIASIAFAEAVAVVDGNVERVLERQAGCTLGSKEFWLQAQSLLDPARPADFNQSMMELGALVCTPREPLCGKCPVRQWCATGTASGTQGRPSRRPAEPRQRPKQVRYILDHRGNRVRLVQRPPDASLMAGMWELPAGPESGRGPKREPWRTFRHSITTTNYVVSVVRTASRRGTWFPSSQIFDIPLTGLARKILKAAGIIQSGGSRPS